MGIYAYSQRALAHLPREGPCQFPELVAAPARGRRAGRRLPQRRHLVRHRHARRTPAGGRRVHALARAFDMSEGELERIRAAYANPDAAANPVSLEQPRLCHLHAAPRAIAATGSRGHRRPSRGRGSRRRLRHRLLPPPPADYGASEAHGIDLWRPDRGARDRYPGLEWRLGSATELPFADGSFDLVTQFTCLSSIVDDAARAASAREMLRVAGRDGRVLSFDMRRASRPGARDSDGRARRTGAASALRRAAAAAPRSAEVRPRPGRRPPFPGRADARAARPLRPTCSVLGRPRLAGCGSASSSTASIRTASAAASAGIARSRRARRTRPRGHVPDAPPLGPGDGAGGPGFDVVAVAPEMPIYAEGRRSIGAQLRFALGVFGTSRVTAGATTSSRRRRSISLCSQFSRRGRPPLRARRRLVRGLAARVLARVPGARLGPPRLVRPAAHGPEPPRGALLLAAARGAAAGARLRGQITLIEGLREFDEPRRRARRPVVVFAGRHIPEKRATAIVPAVALAREELPELEAMIFGDGPERERVLRSSVSTSSTAQ